jgi:phosphoglycolate phosphatase
MKPLSPCAADVLLPGVRAVVFDFDGTLAELTIDFARMRSDLMDLIRQEGMDPKDWSGLYALELMETAAATLAKRAPEKASSFLRRARDVITGIELEAAHRSALWSDTRPLLDRLRTGGIRTALITRNCRAAVRILFPDAHAYLDSILSRDETPRVKPDPEHLLAALRRLDVSPSLSLMVGDHPMDMTLGKAVGARSVGVLTGAAVADALRRSGADHILARASQLPDLLGLPPVP